MRRAALILVPLLAGGCGGGGGGGTISARRLDDLVLQPADVSTSFRHVFIRTLTGAPQLTVRYTRAAAPTTHGPQVIESSVHVFGSHRAADAGVDDELAALRRRPGWMPIDEPGVGDESFAGTLVRGGVRYYEVFWRDSNATASLHVNGFEQRLPLADVLELARKQQRRIAQAG